MGTTIVFTALLIRLSLSPVDISFMKSYMKAIDEVAEKYGKLNATKLKIKLSLQKNAVTFYLGNAEIYKIHEKINNFSAKNFSINLKASKLLMKQIVVSSVNIEDAKIKAVFKSDQEFENFLKKNSPSQKNNEINLKKIYFDNVNLEIMEKKNNSILLKSQNIKGEILLNKYKLVVEKLEVPELTYNQVSSNLEFIVKGIKAKKVNFSLYNVNIDNIKIIGLLKNSRLREYLDNIDDLHLKNVYINSDINSNRTEVDTLLFIENKKINISATSYLTKQKKNKLNTIIKFDEFALLKYFSKNIIPKKISLIKRKNLLFKGELSLNFNDQSIESLTIKANAKNVKNEKFLLTINKSPLKKYEVNEINLSASLIKKSLRINFLDIFNDESSLRLAGNISNLDIVNNYDLVMSMKNLSLRDFFVIQDGLNLSKNYNLSDKLKFLKNGLIKNAVIELGANNNKIEIKSIFGELTDIEIIKDISKKILSKNIKIQSDGERLIFNIPVAQISEGNKKVNLLNTEIVIEDYNYAIIDNFNLTIKANLNSRYSFLFDMAKELKLTSIEDFQIKNLDGEVDAKININIFKGPENNNEIKYIISGLLKSFKSIESENVEKLPIYLKDFNGEFSLATNKGFIKGKGKLNTSDADIELVLDSENNLIIDVLSEAKHDSFDFLKEFKFLSKGNTRLKMKIKTNVNEDKWKAEVNGNLFANEVNLDFIDYNKPINRRATMTANFLFDGYSLLEVKNLNFVTEDLILNGGLFFEENGNLSKVHIKQYIQGKNNFSGTLDNINKSKKKFIIEGERVDIKSFIQGKNSNNQNYELKIKVNELFFKNTNFGKAEFEINTTNNKVVNLLGKTYINDEENVNLKIEKEKPKELKISIIDTGKFLKKIDFSDSILGGMTDVVLFLDDTNSSILNGKYNVKDFSVKNASFLARLLQLASFTGLLEILSTEGIPFSSLNGEFIKKSNTLEISMSRFEGLSLGATLKGKVDIKNKFIDVEGVLVPAYAINAAINKIPLIGKIITGAEGEGLIGIKYNAKGNYEDPEFAINPLSILTPGIIRNIFSSSNEQEEKEEEANQ